MCVVAGADPDKHIASAIVIGAKGANKVFPYGLVNRRLNCSERNANGVMGRGERRDKIEGRVMYSIHRMK